MAIADIEKSTTSKVAKRFVAFLILCYFVAYLDRVNVGFAALKMDKDLGISATAFGFGAGIFFFAYFLFEVPSNMLLDRLGARLWIARIMFTWGIISGAMAFIPQIAAATGLSNELRSISLRVLLGFAEAGFFPGIIFFLTLWFPSVYRARIIGYFMAAIPLSSALGSPVSAQLLCLDGVAGLVGWQWLFIIEALPSLILAFVVYFYLTDRPAEATWLTHEERAWLPSASRPRTRAARMSRRRRRSRASTTRACCCCRWSISAASPAFTRQLLAAHDRQGLRRVDVVERLDQRHPLHRRLPRHGLVGHALGRQGRAHDASRHRAGDRRDRHRRLGLPRQSLCSR